MPIARSALFALLMLSMLWQSALAGVVDSPARTGAGAGVVVHWQDADHHHHADGRLHMDDAADQAGHTHDENACSPQGLPSAPLEQLLDPAVAKPAAPAEVRRRAPHLSGPLRPPRTAV